MVQGLAESGKSPVEFGRGKPGIAPATGTLRTDSVPSIRAELPC